MRNLFLLLICISLCSCASLQLSETKNTKNLTSLGIEWNYEDRVDERYQPLLDSAIGNVIREFNAEKHAFTVRKKLPRDKDKDYITIDFGRGKIVSNGEQIAGYALTTIGLIALPVTLIATETPFIAAFYYFPQNKLDSRVALSPVLQADKYRDRRLVTETGTLFSNRKKQVDKLVKKFSTQLKKTLVDIEKQVKP
jgi:hypothetical protein